MSELLIRRRLDILRQLKKQEQLKVEVKKIRSSENCAHVLTRIQRKWLEVVPGERETGCGGYIGP